MWAAEGGSMADYRLYESALTSGNIATLAAINPATGVSGAFADSDNSLSAVAWYKLSTTTGTVDLSNYGTSGSNLDLLNKDTSDAYQSGFVTLGRATPRVGDLDEYDINIIENDSTHVPANYVPTDVIFTNTYISGSKDIILGQTNSTGEGYDPALSKLTTKGTVVLD